MQEELPIGCNFKSMESTNLFGIPVPSTDKLFLSFVLVHIMIAFIAVVSGLFSMFATKTSKVHFRFGRIYYWSMAASFLFVIVLVGLRWSHNLHLLVIGILAFGFAHVGRRYAHRTPKRIHTILMGMSYIFLLTGFYVDNGKNLPLWNLLPQWSFYALPIAFGVPIILWTLKRHPLNKVMD